MEKGLIHLYWGDGKGKTTAAMGVAMRGLVAGKKVVIVQFLKGAPSGEITLLQQLGAVIYRGKAGEKFVFQMTEEEKCETRRIQNEHLHQALKENADMLILDEACAALQLGMVEPDLLQKAVLQKPEGQELIQTGCWKLPIIRPRCTAGGTRMKKELLPEKVSNTDWSKTIYRLTERCFR